MIAAIEVYNKPDFLYRGETFSILAINSWELLLKAKHIKDCLFYTSSRFAKAYHHRENLDVMGVQPLDESIKSGKDLRVLLLRHTDIRCV